MDSLLENLTSTQVKDLERDVELFDGDNALNFVYFVDHYDLHRYCFPFGLSKEGEDEESHMNLGVISEEQIAYHDFFLGNNTFLLFDEHLFENKKIDLAIRTIKEKGEFLVDSVGRQIEYFQRTSRVLHYEEWKEMKKLENVDYSLLISILIGAVSEGIERLNSLRENKLLFNQSGAEKHLEGKVRDLVIDIQTDPRLSDNLFEALLRLKYEESERRATFPFRAPRSDERLDLKKRMSFDRKCEVFNKLCQLNRDSLESEANTVFILLSSAHTTSRNLVDIARSQGILPHIRGKEFNPIRSVEQLYLKKLLSVRKNDYYVQDLRKMKELIIKKEGASVNEYKSYNLAIINNLYLERITTSQKFENASLLVGFKEYQNLFRDALNKGTVFGKNEDLVKLLEGLFSQGKTEEQLIKLRNQELVLLENEIDFQVFVVKHLDNLLKSGGRFYRTSGGDHVRGLYHHLPVVYFIHNKPDTERFPEIVNDIVLHLISSNVTGFSSEVQVIREIISRSLDYIAKGLFGKDEELMRIVLLLLLENPNELNQGALAEKVAKEHLANVQSEKYRSEYLYVLCWMMRRNRKYRAGKDYCKEGIKKFSGDPRFHHGLALVEYDLLNDEMAKKDGDIKIIQSLIASSISNANKALNLYTNIQCNSEQIESQGLAITISVSAVLNTILYIRCIYFERIDSSNAEFLLESRESFLKRLKANEGPRYYYRPEFLHTEATLEKLEAQLYESATKWELAYEAIRKALSLNPDLEECQELFRELKVMGEKKGWAS